MAVERRNFWQKLRLLTALNLPWHYYVLFLAIIISRLYRNQMKAVQQHGPLISIVIETASLAFPLLCIALPLLAPLTAYEWWYIHENE